MPRYFFDILGPKGETIDDIGQEFDEQAPTFEAAVDVLTEVIREAKLTPQAQRYWCRVRDSRGIPVFQCDISVACNIPTAQIGDDNAPPSTGLPPGPRG